MALQQEIWLTQVRDIVSGNTLDNIILGIDANVAFALSTAQTAYSAANTSNTNALAAYGQANLAYVQANAAYAQANNATNLANQGIGLASNAFNNAATAINIGARAFDQANVAYNAANTAQNQATAGRNQANVAYAQANTALADTLAASGVAPGTYGSGTQIPVLTVDARGRTISAHTVALNNFTSTTSGTVPASGGVAGQYLEATGAFSIPRGSIINQSLAANGFVQFEGGYMEQWMTTGTYVVGDSGTLTYNFPVTFPNACLGVVASCTGGFVDLEVVSWNTTSVTITTYLGTALSSITFCRITFFAKGW